MNRSARIARPRDILLRVEPAVRCLLAGLLLGAGIPVDVLVIHAPCTDVGEFRILHDLDPPTLIVGEMPVKDVHFMHCEVID